jgi:hypothetical protein
MAGAAREEARARCAPPVGEMLPGILPLEENAGAGGSSYTNGRSKGGTRIVAARAAIGRAGDKGDKGSR